MIDSADGVGKPVIIGSICLQSKAQSFGDANSEYLDVWTLGLGSSKFTYALTHNTLLVGKKVSR